MCSFHYYGIASLTHCLCGIVVDSTSFCLTISVLFLFSTRFLLFLLLQRQCQQENAYRLTQYIQIFTRIYVNNLSTSLHLKTIKDVCNRLSSVFFLFSFFSFFAHQRKETWWQRLFNNQNQQLLNWHENSYYILSPSTRLRPDANTHDNNMTQILSWHLFYFYSYRYSRMYAAAYRSGRHMQHALLGTKGNGHWWQKTAWDTTLWDKMTISTIKIRIGCWWAAESDKSINCEWVIF